MGASRLVSAGRGSTSGSGRYPSAFRGPLLMLPGAALGSLAARFCWQGHTHTRHTHVDSLTHTRQTHTRSLTVPFAHGARAGASLDTHTVDAHTFAHGARAHTLGSLAARFCWQGQHFRLWTVPERVSGPPPLMLPAAALGSLAARFCWQGQHFRLWTVPERVSGPAPLLLPGAAGAALQALDGTRARFGAPLLMLPGAALGSLAARFCWQGHTHTTRQTHTRSLTVPFAHGARAGASLDTHTVDAHTFAHGARARFTLDTHLGASRLVSAGRGST